MTDAERAVIEFAAAHESCTHRWEDHGTHPDHCDDPGCLHCRAGDLLPELWCHCGKWQLDRHIQSMWEMPVNHSPQVCETPELPTHCHSCKQPLPKESQDV